MKLSGKMIHEAFVSTLPLTELKVEWDQVPEIARLSYIKTAQILDVKTGQSSAKDIEYLFVGDAQVTEASDIKGLATLVQVKDEDEFKVILIANGQEIGTGWYEVCGDLNKDGTISPSHIGEYTQEFGDAQGLCEQLTAALTQLQLA